ncbi:25801_t:CDS:2 [Gigaspora margarita]|uniref:25801_t:CDS:1 n=1 Tax=Gigaspora margarita TaxID=4874 RepID=A0ABN7UPG3_GIGMA|nr:25801_t:CDS:2 [Gigaspora margarita]
MICVLKFLQLFFLSPLIVLRKKPNVSPNTFEIILRYIYGDIFHLEDYDPFDILDLLIAADEIMIDDVLMDHVQTYLIQSKADWIDENLLDILTIVSPRNSCRKLRDRGSKDCFIFSLGTDMRKANIDEDAKYGYILSDQINYAIYDHPQDGPCFGSGPDLYVGFNCDQPLGYRQNRCYKSGVFNRQGSFRWKDWEIFQIVKEKYR